MGERNIKQRLEKGADQNSYKLIVTLNFKG